MAIDNETRSALRGEDWYRNLLAYDIVNTSIFTL